MIECQLARMVLRDTADQQYVYLREKDGARSFPIVIGIFEAAEINRKLGGEQTARPLTHDLIHNILGELGGRIVRIVVDQLRDNVFHAKLHVEHGGETHQIDSRPSDAIALAVAVGAPIFVEEEVLDAVCQDEL
ncbi:MAG: bifunctional nuclease family protein [Planctomycetota bacterium]